MKKIFLLLALTSVAFAGEPSYRDLTQAVRTSGSFRVAVPVSGDPAFSYALKFGAPIFASPIVADFHPDPESAKFVRKFWDKILLQDGSFVSVGGENIPLTCIFVNGQDNRFSEKDSPLIPDLVLKVYLVANDFTCTGPINPGWPDNGGKRETWDTYVYFEIRDPTIMLPTESKLRYRWADFPAVFMNGGQH